MAPFLTNEQIRALRLRKAKKYKLDGIDKTLNIVQIAAGRGLELRGARAKLLGAEAAGPSELGAAQRGLFIEMFQAGIADDEGEPITAEAAGQLIDLLSLEEVTGLVDMINAMTATTKTATVPPGTPDAGKSEGSPTSS